MKQTYIALLRGINVGGHHKVPMADLRQTMQGMGFENVITLLNSGNIIFKRAEKPENKLEEDIAARLENTFGFPIPVLIRKAEAIRSLIDANPFRGIEVTKDIRLYITFANTVPETTIPLPWISDDQSFRIIDIQDKAVCSVLDISATKTPKSMEVLEQFLGKNITTRNWNTVKRIADKCQ